MIKNMDNLRMDFFEGLQFSSFGIRPACKTDITRLFPDTYGLQYNHEGDFHVEVGDCFERVVSGPWLLITRPGILYRYCGSPDATRLHAWICFRGSRIDEYLASGLLPGETENHLIKITRPERFLSAMERLVELLEPFSNVSPARVVHEFEGLLLQLHEQSETLVDTPQHYRGKLATLAAKIRSDPALDWDFSICAVEMNISLSHFRRLFRQYTGLAPTQFLMRARLQQAAKQIIANPKRELKLIAAEAGYDDYFYFSRLFKKYYGISPLKFRNG